MSVECQLIQETYDVANLKLRPLPKTRHVTIDYTKEK